MKYEMGRTRATGKCKCVPPHRLPKPDLPSCRDRLLSADSVHTDGSALPWRLPGGVDQGLRRFLPARVLHGCTPQHPLLSWPTPIYAPVVPVRGRIGDGPRPPIHLHGVTPSTGVTAVVISNICHLSLTIFNYIRQVQSSSCSKMFDVQHFFHFHMQACPHWCKSNQDFISGFLIRIFFIRLMFWCILVHLWYFYSDNVSENIFLISPFW